MSFCSPHSLEEREGKNFGGLVCTVQAGVRLGEDLGERACRFSGMVGRLHCPSQGFYLGEDLGERACRFHEVCGFFIHFPGTFLSLRENLFLILWQTCAPM